MQEQVNNLSSTLPVSNNGKRWVFWDGNVHFLLSFYLLISVCTSTYIAVFRESYIYSYPYLHTPPPHTQVFPLCRIHQKKILRLISKHINKTIAKNNISLSSLVTVKKILSHILCW